MQDKIPDALIAAFERHYDFPWNEPTLRNERLAWRAAWAEATKPCLHQIQEPAAAEQAALHAGLDGGRAQEAPAAVAVRDAVRDAEKLLRAEAARLERIYSGHGNKWYGFSNEKAAHIEHLHVADALAATPAVAPVVLPEPIGAMSATTPRAVAWNCTFMPEAGTRLYTEQQLRALLATATGLPAQAVPLKLIEAINTACGGNAWQGDALVTDLLEPACRAIASLSPLAQADARDADGMYYLQDARWSAMVGNCPSFWRLGGGYTTNLDEAERFAFKDAMRQHNCRETDLPWLCSELDKLRRPTVDCQYMPRSWDAQRESIAAIAAAKGEGQ